MTRENDRVLECGRELKASLLANPDTFSGYNDLLSLFYKGLPIETLGELLRHPNEHVIAGALFVAEELGGKAAPLLNEIISHINNKNPRIRISAYDALSNSTSNANEGAFAYVVLGMRDLDPHCRKIVILWMMRVRDIRLKAALELLEAAGLDAEIREGLRMLLGKSSQDSTRIQTWILDKNPLIRKFGVIAAGRIADLHPHLLDLAVQSEDADLRICATAQMHFVALQKRRQKK